MTWRTGVWTLTISAIPWLDGGWISLPYDMTLDFLFLFDDTWIRSSTSSYPDSALPPQDNCQSCGTTSLGLVDLI